MQKIILVLIPVLFIFSGIQNSKADTFSLYQITGDVFFGNYNTWEAVGTFQLDKASYKAGDTVYPSLSLTNFKNCMYLPRILGAGGYANCTTSNAVLDSAGINNATTTYSTNIVLKNRGNLLLGEAYFGTLISLIPIVFTPAPMDSVSPIASVNKIESFAIPAGTPATDTDNNYDFILNVNFLGAPFGGNIIFDVPITAPAAPVVPPQIFSK